MRSLLILSILFFCTCKKQDVIENATIQGNVRNNCTGKGFKDVEVFFVASRKGHQDQQSVWTDANGNFSFSGIDVHKSPKYAYYMYIDDKDQYISQKYGHSGVGPIELDKDKILDFKQLGIGGSFSRCIINLPTGVIVTPPDSFTLRFEQSVLHSYEPNRIYEHVLYPRHLNWASSQYSPNWGDYPMGIWYITLDKIKNGVHSVIHDSTYLDMGEVTTYEVPW